MIEEPDLSTGFLDETLRAEFPELALVYTLVEARPRRTPREVRARLREASNRFTGAKAVALRQQPIPWAYRVFFRHVGIDPDEQRTPVEAIALERMRAGGFKSLSLLDDALLLATLETAVPVQAFDADRVEGELGLRLAHPGEQLGGDGRLVPSGQLVIADSNRSVAVLFGEVAPGAGVTPATKRMLVTALRVKGVPDVCVEEALWIVFEMLTEEG